MSEQLELLRTVAERLERIGIAYMLTGSVAASYYAEPRFTRDIDLVVEIPLESADAVAALFEPDFYASAESLRAAIRREGMINLIHSTSLIKIDFITRKNSRYHREEFDRRRQVTVGGFVVWIVSPEDLILSKLAWLKQGGSDVHRRDIASVLAGGMDFDRGYVARWAQELSVAALWKDITA
jgi:Domain of unknown function (DUF1814).